ncbi:MAG: hypothetical protein ACYCZB_12630 [Acidiphilium sp.]
MTVLAVIFVLFCRKSCEIRFVERGISRSDRSGTWKIRRFPACAGARGTVFRVDIPPPSGYSSPLFNARTEEAYMIVSFVASFGGLFGARQPDAC